MNLKTALGTFCLGMFAGCDTASCIRGPDAELDCTNQSEAFRDAYEGDGQILEAIPDAQWYPMAMVLTEAGINELLTGNVGGKVPFNSAVPLGPLSLDFATTGVPEILIQRVPGCGRCILFKVDFQFGLLNADGEGQGSGAGDAEVSIPLELRQNEDGTSALVANYDKATALQLNFTTMGLDSNDEPGLEGAIKVLFTEQLRENYDATELIRFDPWTIGDGDVQLAARALAINYDSRVLSLGFQTNLALPASYSLKVADALPNGLPDSIPMLIQMHPGLLYGMAQRMITEGEIARTYDENGKPDPKGLYGMTLESMEPNKLPKSNVLDVGFRVWRTADDYCGYADAVTGLKLGLSNNNISVTPTSDLRVTGGEGVGELAASDEELVNKNKKLVDEFKRALSEQVGITINYKDIDVDGADIYFHAQALLVTPDAIDIVVDFEVVAEP
ncbi:MAG: hypothetical protein JNL82_16490 [Myxococcales bacterium]|nr:hypothetical protein [Myxococcales bacterium]